MIRAWLIAGTVLLVALSAAAHPGDDPLAVWYRSLETPEGGSCCNMQDCGPVEARQTGDGWEILVADKWLAVPPSRILKRENADGRPIACVLQQTILCFVPPAGT